MYVPFLKRSFRLISLKKKATLLSSARGIYTAILNDTRIGEYVLAPGWTQYDTRIQYQEYDVKELIGSENELTLTLSDGWYLGRISGIFEDKYVTFPERETAVIAELRLEYDDGEIENIITDESWLAGESQLRFCDIYDGLIYDASFNTVFNKDIKIADNNDVSVLIPQQGEIIKEQERVKPIELIKAPNGEIILDFGQNLTGYLEFTVSAKKGDEVDFSFAEILDKDGNFYNKNYRSAKAMYKYICRDGLQTYKPTHTFYGFRYVRINSFPGGNINLNDFTAIVVHSDLRRTGWLNSSNELLNKLFKNVIWGQKSNYLDIPTDCPQRDERLGWTGDAQIFMRTACYNYDVRRFFRKWLNDLKIAQSLNKYGAVPSVVPCRSYMNNAGAAWGDAVTVCPYELYRMFGDKEILKDMFPAMKLWVDCITSQTTVKNLWIGGHHYGDWLELTGEYGKTYGNTRSDLIASAFYAYSTLLVCKAGDVLGENVSEYEKLYKNIVAEYKKYFKDEFITQTECVVTLHFGLTDNPDVIAKQLVTLIENAGRAMQTGFVGTPYILHTLSKYGYSELAYDLLLRTEHPSWLYPVTMGATTMWEHWDGIRPDGKIWPESMNSYNHYAYGSVCDWVYGVACGINPVDENPGFAEVLFTPVATNKIERLYADLDTDFGHIRSGWYHKGEKIVYEITTPVPSKAIIGGKCYTLKPGTSVFEE